jgi:membrane fusion protein, heavy metal efflux system
MIDEKDDSASEHADDERNVRNTRISSRNRNLLIIIGTAVLLGIIALFMWPRHESANKSRKDVSAERKQADEHEAGAGSEVVLSPTALTAAGIEIVSVIERPAVALLRVTGAVEANQQQTQQVTPLVAGRVERVNVVLGDHVRAGSVLAVISSPQIAEMHGKLHGAETRLALTERNLVRVQRAENRSAVLQAKARLDEAEATLRRTQRLIELGAGAGKDLISAEAGYKTAKADYDYQSNIALSRELQQAEADVETARVEVSQIRSGLRALGASVPEGKHTDDHYDISLIALRAPVSGAVTERLVNAGAGIEAGKPLFTIANISTLWVIANVPESQVGHLRVGAPAGVRSAALGQNALGGRINYIDPQLNQDTRTARVRVEVANRNEQLKVGMFVEVGFETGAVGEGTAEGEELVVPEDAIQRVGERTVVFVSEENEPGHFKVRDVELGVVVDGYRRILSGLKVGDKVVSKGSFRLKAQLLKAQFGEDKD